MGLESPWSVRSTIPLSAQRFRSHPRVRLGGWRFNVRMYGPLKIDRARRQHRHERAPGERMVRWAGTPKIRISATRTSTGLVGSHRGATTATRIGPAALPARAPRLAGDETT